MTNQNTTNTTHTAAKPVRRVRAGNAPSFCLHRIDTQALQERQMRMVSGHPEQDPAKQSPEVPPHWHTEHTWGAGEGAPQAHNALRIKPLEEWSSAGLLTAAIGLVVCASGVTAIIFWAVGLP